MDMQPPLRTAFLWHLRTRTMELGAKTRTMAVLNLTPDSFSDGGRFFSHEAALAQALTLLDDGADILDLGGESTRPNATPLTAEEEIERVLPTLRAILRARPEAIVSIDTYHAATARAAVEAGAEIVNDVSGHTWDAAMSATCAELGCGVMLMHARGRPQEWASLPAIPPIARMPIVLTGLRDSLLSARRAGVAADRIVLDPGFGFGKLGDENYTLLALLGQMHQFGLPIAVGVSRKGFLGRTLAPLWQGETAPLEARGMATQAANVAAILGGAHIVRVHDLRTTQEAAAIADAVLAAGNAIAQMTGPAFSPAAANSTTPQ